MAWRPWRAEVRGFVEPDPTVLGLGEDPVEDDESREEFHSVEDVVVCDRYDFARSCAAFTGRSDVMGRW